MTDTESEDLGALVTEMLERRQRAVEEQFVPAMWICRKCAAFVADREQHAGSHKAIEDYTKSVNDAFTKLGKTA